MKFVLTALLASVILAAPVHASVIGATEALNTLDTENKFEWYDLDYSLYQSVSILPTNKAIKVPPLTSYFKFQHLPANTTDDNLFIDNDSASTPLAYYDVEAPSGALTQQKRGNLPLYYLIATLLILALLRFFPNWRRFFGIRPKSSSRKQAYNHRRNR
ncbi:MAG: hypothetical protein GQ582_04740 [Methyloprofundus sp.]|nr:hypothetical protein [Methyloprofundus sp.]